VNAGDIPANPFFSCSLISASCMRLTLAKALVVRNLFIWYCCYCGVYHEIQITKEVFERTSFDTVDFVMKEEKYI